MKRFCSLIVVLVIAGNLPAQQKGLEEARQRWLHGNYAEADEAYRKLLKDPKDGTAAVIGLSRVIQSDGQYEDALKLISDAVKQAKPPAELLARQAELLHLLGRRADALTAAEAALERTEDN